MYLQLNRHPFVLNVEALQLALRAQHVIPYGALNNNTTPMTLMWYSYGFTSLFVFALSLFGLGFRK